MSIRDIIGSSSIPPNEGSAMADTSLIICRVSETVSCCVLVLIGGGVVVLLVSGTVTCCCCSNCCVVSGEPLPDRPSPTIRQQSSLHGDRCEEEPCLTSGEL